MRISDWSSDVCSSDRQVFSCQSPLTLGRGLAQSEECRPRPRGAGDGLGHPRQAFVGTGLVFETPIVQDFDLMGNAVVFADQGGTRRQLVFCSALLVGHLAGLTDFLQAALER